MTDVPRRNFETMDEYFKELDSLLLIANDENENQIRDRASDLASEALVEFRGDKSVMFTFLKFCNDIDVTPSPFFGPSACQAVKEAMGKAKDDLDKERATRIIHYLQIKLRPFGKLIEDACLKKDGEALEKIFSEIVAIATPAVISAEGEGAICRRLSREIIDNQLFGKTDIISNKNMLALEYRLGALVLEKVIQDISSGVKIDLSEYQNLPPVPEKTWAEQEKGKQARRIQIEKIFAGFGMDFNELASGASEEKKPPKVSN